MIITGGKMENKKVYKNNKDLIVNIDDFEKEDDLVTLSKEIEEAKFDDTINLSKYLSDAIDINKDYIKQKNCY